MADGIFAPGVELGFNWLEVPEVNRSAALFLSLTEKIHSIANIIACKAQYTALQHNVMAIAVSYRRPYILPFLIPKPLKRSIQNFARLIESVRGRAEPTIITIRCIYTYVFVCHFLFGFVFICVSRLAQKFYPKKWGFPALKKS